VILSLALFAVLGAGAVVVGRSRGAAGRPLVVVGSTALIVCGALLALWLYAFAVAR